MGRYALYGNPKRGGTPVPPGLPYAYTEQVINPLRALDPHYNVAPTQILPVCTLGDDGPGLEFMRWGLLAGAGSVDRRFRTALPGSGGGG